MTQLPLARNDSPRKNNRIAVFDVQGRRTSISLPKSIFNGEVPESLTLVSQTEFAEVPAPKAKETKEERKLRLSALPKLTLEEKIARREQALEKLKAKLAAALAPHPDNSLPA